VKKWLSSCEPGVCERLMSATGVVDAMVEGSQFRRGLVVNARWLERLFSCVWQERGRRWRMRWEGFDL
jgi:hypothetical protein